MEGEEEDEEDRDKFDLIHRKREMVKNYGKKMFRKVSIITHHFAICGNDRERVVCTCVCLVSLSCGSMSYSVAAMPQVILTLLWRCTTYVCVSFSPSLSRRRRILPWLPFVCNFNILCNSGHHSY